MAQICGIGFLEQEEEIYNKAIVELLYKALRCGETTTISGLVAPDLEWWFHGPPHCEHMMRTLTGVSRKTEFKFEPRSITSIDDRVIVEGWEGSQAYWVHVWSLKDGLIVKFREYFNTWLTVRVLRTSSEVWDAKQVDNSTVWQSEPHEHVNRSLPGLVLAI